MNEHNPEFLALVYLSAKGISRKSLLEAATFFPSDEDTTEISTDKETSSEVAISESPQRGRPTKESMKLTAFYFFEDYLEKNGKLATDRALTDQLEITRKSVVKMFTQEGKSVPKEFLTEVKQTTVKQWRQEFQKLKTENPEVWNNVYLGLLSVKQS